MVRLRAVWIAGAGVGVLVFSRHGPNRSLAGSVWRVRGGIHHAAGGGVRAGGFSGPGGATIRAGTVCTHDRVVDGGGWIVADLPERGRVGTGAADRNPAGTGILGGRRSRGFRDVPGGVVGAGDTGRGGHVRGAGATRIGGQLREFGLDRRNAAGGGSRDHRDELGESDSFGRVGVA